MPPILHHESVTAPGATPGRWMLVAAGIFGAGRNWASVARRFVTARPDWGCILVDLRQHGASRGFPPPHTVEACVDDLVALVHHLGLDVAAVLGHSFGGKVMLGYAARAAVDPGLPHLAAVWVVDSTPAARDPEGSAWRMVGVLEAEPGPFADRSEGITAVMRHGFDEPVAQWMSTNLEPTTDGRLVWRLDPDDMRALLESFFATDAWDVVEAPPPGTFVHLIKARESSILDDAACARIEAAALATGSVALHRVEGGHWVNADDPGALQRLLVGEMP